jgi:hypothetical protein
MIQQKTTPPNSPELVKDAGLDVASARRRLESLLTAIHREFPSFEIVRKEGDVLQRALSVVIAVLTFGGQRSYLTTYHTVLFGKLYVAKNFDRLDDDARYVLLSHERIHLRQRQRMGDVAMAFLYLLPIFPLFLALGRARIEWEAYEATLLATAEVGGLDAAKALEPEIVRRFVGPDYGWMWPFPRTVRRWIRDSIAKLEPNSRHFCNSSPPVA